MDSWSLLILMNVILLRARNFWKITSIKLRDRLLQRHYIHFLRFLRSPFNLNFWCIPSLHMNFFTLDSWWVTWAYILKFYNRRSLVFLRCLTESLYLHSILSPQATVWSLFLGPVHRSFAWFGRSITDNDFNDFYVRMMNLLYFTILVIFVVMMLILLFALYRFPLIKVLYVLLHFWLFKVHTLRSRNLYFYPEGVVFVLRNTEGAFFSVNFVERREIEF